MGTIGVLTESQCDALWQASLAGDGSILAAWTVFQPDVLSLPETASAQLTVPCPAMVLQGSADLSKPMKASARLNLPLQGGPDGMTWRPAALLPELYFLAASDLWNHGNYDGVAVLTSLRRTRHHADKVERSNG